MANQKHLAKLKRGAEQWNEWREENPSVVPDLAEADLDASNLSGANLHHAVLTKATARRSILFGANLALADLSGAILTGARLDNADIYNAILTGSKAADATFHRACLHSADLRQANLTDANLEAANLAETRLASAELGGANLSRANLTGADLSNALLLKTNLTGAVLIGARMEGARVRGIVLAANDLSSTKGLAAVEHEGPSSIGIDTIYASRGKIPTSFLRGAGVPEIFIEYIPALVAPGAIQFYSCFISYSTKDQEFADRLYADLQNKGVRCWFAPHDVQGGKKLHEQIDEAIRRMNGCC